jgi:hypothetical protein
MMSSTGRWAAVALATIALLGGCADRDPAAGTDPDATSEATVEPTDDTTPGPAPSSVAAAAVSDLAGTLGVDEASVEVMSEEEVTWRDGSLGCAQKGMSYTQALVEGTRIVLRVDGTDYEYHASGTRPPFHCPRPTQ